MPWRTIECRLALTDTGTDTDRRARATIFCKDPPEPHVGHPQGCIGGPALLTRILFFQWVPSTGPSRYRYLRAGVPGSRKFLRVVWGPLFKGGKRGPLGSHFVGSIGTSWESGLVTYCRPAAWNRPRNDYTTLPRIVSVRVLGAFRLSATFHARSPGHQALLSRPPSFAGPLIRAYCRTVRQRRQGLPVS